MLFRRSCDTKIYRSAYSASFEAKKNEQLTEVGQEPLKLID